MAIALKSKRRDRLLTRKHELLEFMVSPVMLYSYERVAHAIISQTINAAAKLFWVLSMLTVLSFATLAAV